jgi:hypothetical protein
MEQLRGARPRRLDLAWAAVWAVAILTATALTACGPAPGRAPGRHRAPRDQSALSASESPVVSGLSLRAARAPRSAMRANSPRAKRPRPSWRIDPDAPLPRHSPWWPILAVAHRFAAADMSYEVDEVGPAVRSAITQTCTRAFAAALLDHRASLPPGVSVNQVRQRLVTVQPLERLPGAAEVLATVRGAKRGRQAGAAGAFELRLLPRSGGWRVAGLDVV